MATKPVGPRLNDPIEDASTLPVPKRLLLGLQHLFTMFGSTVLVPLTTGLDVATVLLMGGIGTLICHLCTKGKVPVYLGSSFAYITPVIMAAQVMGGGAARPGLCQRRRFPGRYRLYCDLPSGLWPWGLTGCEPCSRQWSPALLSQALA